MNEQEISGNQDFPEGGFDGFLQSIVCGDVRTVHAVIIMQILYMIWESDVCIYASVDSDSVQTHPEDLLQCLKVSPYCHIVGRNVHKHL